MSSAKSLTRAAKAFATFGFSEVPGASKLAQDVTGNNARRSQQQYADQQAQQAMENARMQQDQANLQTQAAADSLAANTERNNLTSSASTAGQGTGAKAQIDTSISPDMTPEQRRRLYAGSGAGIGQSGAGGGSIFI